MWSYPTLGTKTKTCRRWGTRMGSCIPKSENSELGHTEGFDSLYQLQQVSARFAGIAS